LDLREDPGVPARDSDVGLKIQNSKFKIQLSRKRIATIKKRLPFPGASGLV
jgi:hypothetical protein